jgi:hypothetical protein
MAKISKKHAVKNFPIVLIAFFSTITIALVLLLLYIFCVNNAKNEPQHEHVYINNVCECGAEYKMFDITVSFGRFVYLSNTEENEPITYSLELLQEDNMLDLNKEISASSTLSWRLYSDKSCQNEIKTRVVFLKEGTNTYFVAVSGIGDEPVLHKIIVEYRKISEE